MCFQVYFGSSHQCPEIPYAEARDPIFVRKLPEHSEYSGTISLESTHLYHLGLMSCGCGFTYDFPVGQQDEWRQNNHRQLVEYLRGCLQNADPISLFSCPSGDEYLPVETHRQITLQDLQAPDFYFGERQITVVCKDQSSFI
jgi:hypothetical protein